MNENGSFFIAAFQNQTEFSGKCVTNPGIHTEILVFSLLCHWAGGELSLNDSILQLA